MERRFFGILIITLSFTILLSLFINVSLSAWSSPSKQFNVTPDTVYLNWTNNYNNSFKVMVNDTYGDWFNVTIDNATAATINVPYSLYFNYTSSVQACGGTVPCAKLLIQNETGYYVTQSKNLTNTSIQNNATFYAIVNISPLWSGRYRGTIRIYNTSTPAEHCNITAILDVPITVNNDTGIGIFNGTLPSNAITYQSFYFNTSAMQNATGIKINISWGPSQDIDIFLFDNSTPPKLLAKSIDKSSNFESLIYSFLPSTEKIWEIRIYGNSTTGGYDGNIFFSTLNTTNRTLGYSVRNVSYSDNSTMTLNNTGNINMTNVLESKELFHVIRFGGNGTRNFTFLVPDSTIAQKIKISLNWTASTSAYKFNLYKPDGTLSINSLNKYIYANLSNAEMEEYNETTDVIKGNWTVEIKNSTSTAIDPYNVTVYIKVNEMDWILTNYTASGFTFNTAGQPNSTYTIQINFTVPNNAMNGIYEGSLKYLDKNGVGILIPIKVNVTTPVLIVNQTWNSTTVIVVENINATLSRILNITLRNTGSYNISSITTWNSTSLNYGNYYINFSYQVPANLSVGDSGIMNVTINLNSSITNDTVGIYKGWIFLNTSSSQYASYPYQGFNLSIEFNLTNLLDVRVTGVNTYDTSFNWIQNVSTLPRNVTIQYLNIYYINGTQITGSLLYYPNITSVRLYHANTTYWTSYLNKSETGFIEDFELSTGNYQFNITIPSDLPGGEYEVHVNLTNVNGKLQGESSNKTLFVNETGLYISSLISPPSLGNNTQGIVNVSIRNYGPKDAADAQIKITKGTCISSVDTVTLTGCSATGQSGETVTILSIPKYTTSDWCYVAWTIRAGSAATCTSTINGTVGTWFNSLQFSTTVTGPTEEDGDEGDGYNYTLPTYVAGLAFSEAESLIIVQQNSSNSTIVTVSNTGNISQSINFTIEDINSTWYTLNSTNASLLVGKFASFLVNFNIGSVEIKEYSGKWKAYSINKTITSDFTLKVIPSEEEKVEINNTLALYKVNATNLETDINQSKEEGVNVSQAEEKLSELKAKIQEAEDYIAQEDYFSAYQLFREIDLLFIQTRNKLNEAIEEYEEEEKPWFELPELPADILIYVGIGVGIAAAIILAYLFWPTPTKPKKYIFKPKHKEEKIWNQLKQKWAKLSKRKEKK